MLHINCHWILESTYKFCLCLDPVVLSRVSLFSLDVCKLSDVSIAVDDDDDGDDDVFVVVVVEIQC